MTEGHRTLTEKEKQALRLLTNGYDAKAMARHLGLSIHTVNERLRDARRKMATSSSREAARLLREAEGLAPENPVPDTLRDAAADDSGAQLWSQTGDPPRLRKPSWMIGGIAMSIALVTLALAAMSEPASPPQAVSAAEVTSNATVAAAQAWLALVDAGNWDASWNATGQAFKALNTAAKWAEVSKSVRTPLGAVKSRALIGAEDVPVPPYGAWIVKFRTSYANKPNAVETVSLARENSEWRVVGVYIE
jgi:DNA-binding CsgD family transcriptional regulator